jgi:hypothetical protein
MTDREKLQKWIEEEAESFFEFPTEKRERVTYTSCLLFAEHILSRGLSYEKSID